MIHTAETLSGEVRTWKDKNDGAIESFRGRVTATDDQRKPEDDSLRI